MGSLWIQGLLEHVHMNGQTYVDHYVTNVDSAILHSLEVQTLTESTRILWKKYWVFFQLYGL